MRADLDAFFRHDKRAVHEGEIANRTCSILAQSERAPGVTGNVIADPNRARRGGVHVSKNLRGLAIKSFAEDDIRRNRLGPPIAFHATRAIYVTHNCGTSFQLALSLDRKLETCATTKKD